jgi:hypothetical protein
MASEGKVCVHCREVNPAEARECRNCGRFFIRRPGAGRAGDAPGAEALKQPAVICALLLFVSLFLPWFTLLIFSLSAFQLLGLFPSAADAGVRFGGSATLALARLLIALVPVGSLAVVILALRGASVRFLGAMTGALPVAVFLLFFLQSSAVLNIMGAGFVVAILAGIGLIAFSRNEP